MQQQGVSAPQWHPDQIRIVLVNTSHPGNIGATARAMKNMGLQRLVLVQPEDFPSGVAVGRAASAVDLLDQSRVVDTLEEAVADCGLVIGASARCRSLPWPLLDAETCADKVLAAVRNNRVALVFGREDCGLNNAELQLCHYHLQIPANPEYSSLNLAAAVLLVCYELRKAGLRLAARGEQPQDYWDQPWATAAQLEHFHAHLERVLVAIHFHDPDNPRQLLQRLRRLFGRIRIDAMEMNMLRGMLGHIEQAIDDNKTRPGKTGTGPELP